ncbi:outer membrane lipid asymmetry maintenance protein MlaD [Roseiterribacter gracilis]|uniref:Outer membrane lipid asymmetry maintenance protein MlaD n=1 Tax=Roseiterribacter gracilis TaxID=2812848 RepID=A0A8S8XF75_9PROT|nr:outer membrane lipid asymmetry maintenance protein MlaD [Rhodospirillales bacterium TMPK1]
MNRSVVEPILGALILFVAIGFLVFAYGRASTPTIAKGYELTARFSAIDGLSKGSDVRVSGVKVGQVADIKIEPTTFLAIVRLVIDPAVQLPKDSLASVTSEGLLGGKFVALEPGSDDARIPNGGRIERTQSAASLDKLLGQVIFSLQNLGGDKDKNANSGNAPATAAPK